MSPEDKAACTVMAAVLDQGRIVNGLSWPIAALTFVAVPFIGPHNGLIWTWLALCAFAAALLQAYLAARVALDADLFRALGKGKLEPQPLDASLRRLALIKEEKLGRPLEQRLWGAMRLLKMQVGSLVVQLFLTLSFFILLRRM